LRGVPSLAGPGSAESCTPTGAALLTTLADAWGPQPAMTVAAIGVGAGGRDPDTHANVLRILTGSAPGPDDSPLLIESNVDDLDPRVWPSVISALFAAGANDAWLTPILMKKGRPAHTLSVLTSTRDAERVRATLWRHTSTIGVREIRLDDKHVLDREMVAVEVAGQRIAVKLARHEGAVVNAQPEWEDVARAATTLGRPANDVLADAIAATRALLA
jgi:pyridinium-3,5-bisthiocarboxylic acid mononucleotide nickel chelatase